MISVLSWNILGPATRDVADYGFIPGDYGRLGKHLKMIQQYQADILCFQEIDLTSLHLFNSFLLSEYIQASYHEKGAHGGVAVYVRTSIFDVVNSIGTTLQTSENYSPGAFSGTIVKNKIDGIEIFVASVHLSKSVHPQSVEKGVNQVFDLCKSLGSNLPSKVILVGDYNTMYNDMKEVILPIMSKELNKNLFLFEYESCVSPDISGEVSSIDHVVYSGMNIDLEKSCVITLENHRFQTELKKDDKAPSQDDQNKQLPSDHSPLLVFLK